jgi:DNA polymerase-3 subunit epsilon
MSFFKKTGSILRKASDLTDSGNWKGAGVQVGEEWNWNPTEGFVVIDLETTGLSPKSDRVLEIAVIQTSVLGEPLAYWSSLINPGVPVGATEIHGIKDSDVLGFPTFESIADELFARLKGQAISAHNARFDLGFLKNEFARSGWILPEVPTVCTMEASKYFLPQLTQRRLSDCAKAIGLNESVSHRALSDASTTVGLLNYYLRRENMEGSPLGLRSFAQSATSIRWSSEKSTAIAFSVSTRKTSRSDEYLDANLLTVLLEISPDDLIDSDELSNGFEYAELLIEALEDGKVSANESQSLMDVSESLGLSPSQTDAIHVNLLLKLATEAWKDGVVTQAEKRHVKTFASLLGLDETKAKEVLDQVEDSRTEKLSSRSKELPDNWALGPPIRVGERVAFTGCDDFDRFGLERKATRKGLRVTGTVSKKTNLLISDGTVQGNKTKAAEEFGVRVVHPTTFVELLNYIQPAVLSAKPDKSITTFETLTCQTCGSSFQRVSVKGRKPLKCPDCSVGQIKPEVK